MGPKAVHILLLNHIQGCRFCRREHLEIDLDTDESELDRDEFYSTVVRSRVALYGNMQVPSGNEPDYSSYFETD